jgi:hypothetical protein
MIFIKSGYMKTQSPDTHPKTEKVLISLIQKASPAQKIHQVRSLSQTVMLLSKRAIARANPDLSQRELDLLFVSYHYGEDLADRLRKYLEERSAACGKS